jgi:hypothetical protein
VVDAGAATREEDRGAPIEHALHEDPLAGRLCADTVDLGRAEDCDGVAAVEQDVLGRDLVRPVALA